MATYGIVRRPRRADDLAVGQPDPDLDAHIEGLCGKEPALLAIPTKERTRQKRDPRRANAGELGQARQLLRARAARVSFQDNPERGCA
jgi:hypothetical protein